MFSVLGKLGWFFRENKKRYITAVLLLAFADFLEVIPPFLIGKGIDGIVQSTMTTGLLWELVGSLIGLMVLSYATSFYWQYQLFGGAILIERQLRTRLMRKFLKMAPPFYERNRTGDLMARSTNDLQAVSETAGFGIMTLVDSSVYMLFLILMMGAAISWKLTLLALLPLPLLAWLMQVLGKRIHDRFTAAQSAFGDLNDSVLEAVAGVRVVRAYVQERAMERSFAADTADVFQKNMAVEKINALFTPITKILTSTSFAIGVGYGAILVSRGELTVGELVTFNVYLTMIVWPMFAIGELINVLQRGEASLDRVQATLASREDIVDPEKPIAFRESGPIGFENIAFQYPLSQTPNLSDIRIRLEKGQTLGIVGKTGSGKTTFVKQLLREYPLTDGALTIAGVDIANQTKEQVRSWIGYVPQDQMLFSRSIKENILFGNPGATDEEVDEAVRLADFEQDLQRLPQGYATLVGEKGVALSGGQKQRISIARALIKDPDILLLDDSLSAVDAKTEARIIHNIQAERSGKTTIITTHRLSAVAHADWIIVLEEGRVIQEGSHAELIARNGWYREQFERQQLEEVQP